MARPIRLEFGGALYHVTARGDRREAIYEDDADREQFLAVLGDVAGGFNWRCHAYCLMSNHYHLVVETPDGNLSAVPPVTHSLSPVPHPLRRHMRHVARERPVV